MPNFGQKRTLSGNVLKGQSFGNAFTGHFLAMPSTDSFWQCPQRILSGNALNAKLFMAMPSKDTLWQCPQRILFWQCLHRTLFGNAFEGHFMAMPSTATLQQTLSAMPSLSGNALHLTLYGKALNELNLRWTAPSCPEESLALIRFNQ